MSRHLLKAFIEELGGYKIAHVSSCKQNTEEKKKEKKLQGGQRAFFVLQLSV